MYMDMQYTKTVRINFLRKRIALQYSDRRRLSSSVRLIPQLKGCILIDSCEKLTLTHECIGDKSV
nr:hypothetical protein Iba_scaffold33462CG0040 [Ipomoea batatas]GMD35958.1 hypothetical protein Iba_chr09dCG11850 [Ipomoea batatas]